MSTVTDLKRMFSWPFGCATLERGWSLWALRAEGWEWSGGLPDICPHLALLLLGEDLLLTREHLNSTQATLMFFPPMKLTHTKGMVFACFLSPEK